MQFQPGNLVQARSRVWVVQSDSTDDWLILRPLGGSEDEITKLIPSLEQEPVSAVSFPLPDPNQVGSLGSAKLLYNALRFQLRSSSGPFRCFGSINFEPRSYQFVPLLMAMRQKTVRLLIADDVGVGKTIESGLILRELIDRGEVQRFAVLCPPHLVEQWCDELEHHFNINATPLTAANSKRIEAMIPHGHLLTEYCPHLVVSLDYIKGDKHRDYFENMPIDLLLVDEAHTCVRNTQSKQKRFDLVQKMTKDPNRHVLLLTATPHSGNDDAFFNLLSLLDEKFIALKESTSTNSPLRRELSNYFIQRRRQDIKEWKVDSNERLTGFPVRMTAELSYELDSQWEYFLERIKDYCQQLLSEQELEGKVTMQSSSVYETIALFRCVSSSPAAAVQTLKNRLNKIQSKLANAEQNNIAESDSEDIQAFSAALVVEQDFAFDDNLEMSDQEPSLLLENSQALEELIKEGSKLYGINSDPKLQLICTLVQGLLQEGYQPVIFCRFVSTAQYVADCLKEQLLPIFNKGQAKASKKANDSQIETPYLQIGCVTGELVPDDRRARIEDLMQSPLHVLVATDCLSEGINLQQAFTSVIHYDLAWNPTRHEQREGRVDRFGQTAPEVRCAMIHCINNTIDQLVLNVITHKNENIKRALGVSVPVPQQAEFLEKSILIKMLSGREIGTQLDFLSALDQDLANMMAESKKQEDKSLDIQWEDSLENANKQTTIFAQRKIHPEDIAPLWQEQQKQLGSFFDVLDFAKNACATFGCILEPVKKVNQVKSIKTNFAWTAQDSANAPTTPITEGNQRFYFPLMNINQPSLRQSFIDEGFEHREILDFSTISRASPFISVLSATIVEQGLSGKNSLLSRCALSMCSDVDKITRIYILRLRHQMRLTYNNQVKRNIMVEEIVPIMAQGSEQVTWDTSDKVYDLILNTKGEGNLSSNVNRRHIGLALDLVTKIQPEKLNELADQRAAKLQSEHSSIKQFTSDGHVTMVQPCKPVDIMGVIVLLPKLD